MKQLWIVVLSVISVVAYGGAYRHDVPAEKYLALAKEKQFDCVGEIMHKSEGGGSCVLISDRFVLSAAHVFIESDNVADTIMVNGSKVITYKATNERIAKASDIAVRLKRRRYQAKRIILFPEYLNGNKRLGDLALIELDEAVDGIDPAELNKQFDELNAIVTGVGFGASGRADKPEEVDLYMEKIAGQNTIDAIEGKEWNGKQTLLTADFDKPGDTAYNLSGSALPVPMEYGTCGSDSGGPLFYQKNNEWKVIGICVGGGVDFKKFLKYGYYGQNQQWLRVSVFYDWITKTMNEMKQASK